MRQPSTTALVLHDGDRLVDAVYRAVHTSISEGTVAAGTRLVEQDMANEMGVSRTPVREALRRLESEGMLKSEPHRGFVVVDFLEEALTVYAIRQALEGIAARMAAEKITVPELRELAELARQMEELCETGRPEDIERVGQLNLDFHSKINQIAGSAQLNRFISQVTPAFLVVKVVQNYDEEGRRRSLQEHHELLQALWNRDGKLAESLVLEHLEHGKPEIVRLDFQNRQKGANPAP
jgi:DNA-binding GntR family transcriptional regulator